MSAVPNLCNPCNSGETVQTKESAVQSLERVRTGWGVVQQSHDTGDRQTGFGLKMVRLIVGK